MSMSAHNADAETMPAAAQTSLQPFIFDSQVVQWGTPALFPQSFNAYA